MVLIYGADAVADFRLFAAPAENELVWQETGIEGAVRFMQRVYRFVYRWHEALENANVRKRADGIFTKRAEICGGKLIRRSGASRKILKVVSLTRRSRL